MAANRPYTTWGKFYGRAVIRCTMSLIKDPNPYDLPVVPEDYVEQAKEFISWYESEMLKRRKKK